MKSRSVKFPNFLIIGGMRCGSTTLANILNAHGSVYVPEDKELHYFDLRNPAITTDVDYRRYFQGVGTFRYVGEATPDYLSTTGCARRIFDQLPEVKLIIILRDPVRRAWSHYRFSVACGFEIEPFDEALRLEAERLAHPIHEHDIYFSYQQRGRYIEHIDTYLGWFRPEQIHIVILEELVAEPEKTVAKLFEFLKLDDNPHWRSALRITNQASLIDLAPQKGSPVSAGPLFKFNLVTSRLLSSPLLGFMPQSVRDHAYRRIESRLGHEELPERRSRDALRDYFTPFNQALMRYLGRQLPWL